MLCESMVGAHGSTGNGNPHTIPALLPLQGFHLVLPLRLFRWPFCRKLVGGFKKLGALQRDARGRDNDNDNFMVPAISLLSLCSISSLPSCNTTATVQFRKLFPKWAGLLLSTIKRLYWARLSLTQLSFSSCHLYKSHQTILFLKNTLFILR